MDALKLNLYQETAVYRNPVTAEIIESYPLPPPSTILGLIHQLIGAKEMIPDIDISIQGNHGALIRDYQHYKKGDSIRPYPIIVNALNDMKLIIHVKAAEPLLTRIEDAFHSPPYYPYLGRAEDLLKVEGIRRVSCEEIETDEDEILTPCYIRKELADAIGVSGVLFRLATYYQFENVRIGGKDCKVRCFEWCDYMYIERDYIDRKSKLIVDTDADKGEKVWWCMPNHGRLKI
jgi:CRISPR-associated protein Cas5t